MNFEKEYIYNFQNSDETECKVINKIKIGDNEKGTYDVLVEYKIEEEKTGEDLYISALEFETKKLIPGKTSALVTENNVLEELLKGTEKNEKIEMSSMIKMIDKALLKTATNAGLNEKEKGGICVRKSKENYKKNRSFELADLETVLATSDGLFDSYFITQGNFQIESTPISFSYSENQKRPQRKFEFFHMEDSGFKATIQSNETKCSLGEKNNGLSNELKEKLKKMENFFEKVEFSSLVSYHKKNKILEDLKEAIITEENNLKTIEKENKTRRM